MAEKPLIVIGGGGHTAVLIGMLKRDQRAVQGILTRDTTLVGESIHGVPVIGLEGESPLSADAVQLVNGVGNVASRNGSGLEVRTAIYSRYHAEGFTFASVISSQAIIQPDVLLGEGVQVMPGVVIQPGVMLGANCIVNTRASLDHDVVIGPHSHIAPGAVLCGHVTVGERAHIGAGAVVIQQVRIGHDAVIGAGAIVTRDVGAGEVVLPKR